MEILHAGYKAAFFLVFALVVFSICRKVTTVSRSLGSDNKFAAVFCAGVGVWYVLSLVLSLNGFFRSSVEYSRNDLSGLFVLVGMMMLPLVLFSLAYRATDSLKRIIDRIDIRALIGIQVYRICGTYFLFLAWTDRSPALFALPTGVLDLLIGVFALIIPGLLARRMRSAEALAAGWNYLGLLDFVSAFTVYFLYFPFRVLEAPAPQLLIGGFFPIAFIIMFPVPLAVVLHVLALLKLRKPAASLV